MTESLEQLRSLLIEQEFERADLLTTSIILNTARRQDRGWLRLSDGETLPDALLVGIGSAWSGCTGGRHGFQIQRRLFSIDSEKPTDFVAMAVKFGWRSDPGDRPVREDAAAVPRYSEFVAGGDGRDGFFPTLRNPEVEDYPAWYDRWKRTVLAVHLRFGGWKEES